MLQTNEQYSSELLSIQSEISELRKFLLEIQSCIDVGWIGKSGTSAWEMVEQVKTSLAGAENDIEDIIQAL